jgi:hypothetical protein
MLDRIIEALGNVRPLDCGAHYCRYCPAGTHNQWQHGPSCPYAESQKDYEEAQQLKALLGSGKFILIEKER